MTMLQKLKDEAQPDAVAIAFDLKAPTFRHKMYAGYKHSARECLPSWPSRCPH